MKNKYVDFIIKDSYEYWYAVPSTDYIDHGNLFEIYHHRIKIFNVTERPIADLRGMENWCKKNCGALEETDPDSPWQISREREDSKTGYTYTCTLIFYFINKQDAMRFKLAWV